MKKSLGFLSFVLALSLIATSASATRLAAAYTLTQSDSAKSLTNVAGGPITVSIPHGLTLPFSVLINGGKGGVNLGVLTADLMSGDGYIDPGTSALVTITGNNTNNTISITIPSAPLPAATTSSIGGGALAAGACTTGTAAIAGASTAMVAIASPVTYPGDGAVWHAYVSSAGVVTVVLCSIAGQTPTASVYNVRAHL